MQFLFKLIFMTPLLLLCRTSDAIVFDSGISYFSSSDKSQESKSPVPEEKKPSNDSKKFDWNKYLDTEKDEFFKEGDYIPPAPFMEALRRPTKENILLFEKWKQTKNLLLQRYEKARSQWVDGSVRSIPSNVKAVETSETEVLSKFKFSFYFDAKCPSCHAMFSTINQMAEKGVYVEAVRVDAGSEPVRGLLLPWSRMTPEESKKVKLKAVPFLMAFDDGTKRVYQITGHKTITQLASTLERASERQN